MRITLIYIVLMAISASVGFTQEPSITETFRFVTTIQPEIHVDDQWGNQSWVREYDKEYNPIDIGRAESLGYSGPWQYNFQGWNFLTGPYLVDLTGGYRNDVSVQIGLSKLIHRLDWIPTPEPGLSPPSSQTTYVPVFFTSESFLDRKAAYAQASWRLPFYPEANLVGEYWAQNKEGLRQLFWFGRTAPIAFQRAGSGIPVDNHFSEPAIGFDADFGRNTSVSYRFLSSDFEGTKTPPILPGLPNEPIRFKNEPDTDTDTNDIRLSSNLSDSLVLTGYFVDRDRSHKTDGINAVVFPATLIPITQNVEANITTGNLALDYLPSQKWYVTAKHYRSNYDTNAPDIVDPVSGGLLNQAMSWRNVSTCVDANYTGVRRWNFGLGYEFLEVRRFGRDPHGDHEEFSHALFFDDSDHNIVRASVTGRPTDALSFRVAQKYDSVDVAGYRGVGDAISDFNASIVYTPRIDTMFNASFYRRHENNGVITVLPPLLAPTDPGYEEQREFLAGGDYENTVNSFWLGAWQGITDKLALDLGYGRDDVSSQSLWVLGIDPAFLPHLPPFITPYEAESNVYHAGLTYNPLPKWRIRGDVTYVDSFGKSFPDIFQITRPGDGVVPWNPVSRKDTRWGISVGYLLNPSTQINVEYDAFNWHDNIDPTNDGHFDVVTIAGVFAF